MLGVRFGGVALQSLVARRHACNCGDIRSWVGPALEIAFVWVSRSRCRESGQLLVLQAAESAFAIAEAADGVV